MKQKILIGFLVTLVLGIIGLMYYNNVYLNNIDASNKITVIVATSDIPVGGKISKQNVAYKKIDKSDFASTYVTDFSKINGKLATTEILDNEKIDSRRIAVNATTDSANDKFTLQLSAPASFVKVGDYVRIYVSFSSSKENLYDAFILFDKKQVVSTNAKKDESGNITSESTIDINVSDEDVLRYDESSKLVNFAGTSSIPNDGKVTYIVVGYNDLTAKDKLGIKPYTAKFSEIEKVYDSALSGNATVGTSMNSVSYTIKLNDTLDKISKQFNTTTSKIKSDNPEASFKVGTTIIIKI